MVFDCRQRCSNAKRTSLYLRVAADFEDSWFWFWFWFRVICTSYVIRLNFEFFSHPAVTCLFGVASIGQQVGNRSTVPIWHRDFITGYIIWKTLIFPMHFLPARIAISTASLPCGSCMSPMWFVQAWKQWNERSPGEKIISLCSPYIIPQ
jgi:hypothetical protein